MKNLIEGWYEVDESGHIPFVAAELPRGHRVYLDAAGNIGAIEPLPDAAPPPSSPNGGEVLPASAGLAIVGEAGGPEQVSLPDGGQITPPVQAMPG
jgi:hypothetical protein